MDTTPPTPSLPTELLEKILLHLPIHDLLFAKNVSKNWQTIILHSTPIRDRLLQWKTTPDAIAKRTDATPPFAFHMDSLEGTLITARRNDNEVSILIPSPQKPLIVLHRVYLPEVWDREDEFLVHRWADDKGDVVLKKDHWGLHLAQWIKDYLFDSSVMKHKCLRGVYMLTEEGLPAPVGVVVPGGGPAMRTRGRMEKARKAARTWDW